jgi:uncharacterized protein (DUF58 family)
VNPLFKILYRAYRFISAVRHRVPRRVTRPGLAVLGGCLVLAITGLDTDNMVAYQGFALLLFLLLVSVPFVFFFPARFSAERLLPRFGTAGTPLRYRVRVTNLTPKPQRGLTLLENLGNPWPAYGEWLAGQRADRKWIRSFRPVMRRRADPFKTPAVKDAAVPPIPPHQQAEAAIELTPLRRGALRFSGLTLARPDPLCLFRSFARVPLPQTVLILPKRYPLPAIALPGRTKYQQGGVTFASDVGQSEEFVALRDYRRGDPLRRIHWRSWAKAGKPIVKEFEDEFFVRHALLLDTFIDDPQSELFEEAVSVAASFACTVLDQESLLDLLFVGPQAYCFTAGRGLAHTDQILEILASVRACADRPFRTLESLVLDHAANLSGSICVLLAWDEPRQNLVKKLKALGLPALVVVLTDAGQRQSLDPGPLRDEPQRFHLLQTGRIEQGLAKLA